MPHLRGMASVKNYLKGLTKPQLEGLVLELCARNPQAKEYVALLVSPGKEKAVFDKYCKRMEKCFPPLPKEPDLAGAQRILAEYASVGNDGELAMLLMWHASLGAKYTHDFGDMDADFYAAFEESYEQSLALAEKHDMVEKFRVPADEVARYAYGTGYGFADEIHSIYRDYFGTPPPLPERPVGALRQSAPAPAKNKGGQVVQGDFGPRANNPFGALAPNEVLCIESRQITTRQDGTVWMYVAMDAHSRYAFHHTIKTQSILPEYFIFITDALKKHPELKGSKLVVDTPAEMVGGFKKLFPHFSAVVSDKAVVAEVTEEFHTAFLAHMAQQGRSN